MAGSPHSDVERGRCAGMGPSGGSCGPWGTGGTPGSALRPFTAWVLWVRVLLQHKDEVNKPRALMCPGSEAGHGMGPRLPLPTSGSEGGSLSLSSQHCCARVSLVQAIPAVLVPLLASAGLCGVTWNLSPPRDPQGVCGDQLSCWRQAKPMLCS